MTTRIFRIGSFGTSGILGKLTIEEGYLKFSNLADSFQVRLADIETVTVETYGLVYGDVKIIGKGTELARIKKIPKAWARKAQEWVLANFKMSEPVTSKIMASAPAYSTPQPSTSGPWYKTWWGILLTIALFPFVVPYLVWTKTTWNKWIKISITALCAIIVISQIVNSNQRNQEALDLINQAETFISENKIDDALVALNKSQELNTTKNENPAFELEEKIIQFQSLEFLKETLVNISDSDFDLLEKGELTTSFINHDELNKLFIAKLKENADQRALYITEAEELKKQEQEEAEAKAREEMIEKQFSVWDGSHINLSSLIKNSMNDPDSYEHVETVYWDMGDYLIVSTTFRGKNAFGGVVTNAVKAKISLDGENIEILEQY